MQTKSKRKSNIIFLGYGIGIIAIILAVLNYHEALLFAYENPETARETIASFGPFGPLVLILAQIFQVIIFIIPGPAMTIAGGYAFGVWWGFVYSFIGTLIGSLLFFFLGRKYGRPFVERFVRSSDIEKYDEFTSSYGVWALLLCRLAPIIIPNDAISLAASLSNMTWRKYLTISFFGFIPNILVITIFGDRITQSFLAVGAATFLIIGASSIIYALWRRAERKE